MYVWREERGSLSFAHVRPRAHLEVIRGVQDVVHPGDLGLARNGRPVLARVELLRPVDKKTSSVIPIAHTIIKINVPPSFLRFVVVGFGLGLGGLDGENLIQRAFPSLLRGADLGERVTAAVRNGAAEHVNLPGIRANLGDACTQNTQDVTRIAHTEINGNRK